MSKLSPFALAAIAVLSACSTTPPQATTPNIVTNVQPLQPGSGVVQNVMPAPVMAGAEMATGGPLQRLEVRMQDGRVQYVDTSSREIARGDRIQISADHLITRI
jgi:hypothetical protein